MTVQESTAKRPGQIVLGWWSHEVGDRASASARGLAARLRRASAIAALTEPAVHQLITQLALKRNALNTQRLLRLVRVLAEVREHTDDTLAQRLGRGDPPAMSSLRFQRLMRAKDEELVMLLRRTLTLVDRRCNVAALGEDLLFWNDVIRTRWCFQYFGAALSDNTINPTALEQAV